MNRWLRRLLGRRHEGEGPAPETRTVSATATTEAVTIGAGAPRLVQPPYGWLTVVQGPTHLLTRRFALRDDEVSIGRTEECYVSIPDTRVSRLHAQVMREGPALFLAHRSHTNRSFVNGIPVEDRAALRDGDRIQLADRVVLQLEASTPAESRRPPGGLRAAMEARVEIEDRIARDFIRDGSFLDVDVVDSSLLKLAEPRTERVVVSFERFRAFVESVVDVHQGQVLNSNGDEVMAFFASADAALRCGRALLRELPGWNARENLLPQPFRVRAGLHTGRSAVDLERGVAYSPVLDGAGHLQKAAPVGGLLLSNDTWHALSHREGLEPAGAVGKQTLEAWRLAETS